MGGYHFEDPGTGGGVAGFEEWTEVRVAGGKLEGCGL